LVLVCVADGGTQKTRSEEGKMRIFDDAEHERTDFLYFMGYFEAVMRETWLDSRSI